MLLMTVAACNTEQNEVKYNYKYVGESNNWTAVYYVEGSNTWEGKQVARNVQERLIITYKGANPTAVRDIAYSYKTSVGGGERTGVNLTQNNEIIESNPITRAIPNEKENVQVVIKWNGQEEKLQLKNEE